MSTDCSDEGLHQSLAFSQAASSHRCASSPWRPSGTRQVLFCIHHGLVVGKDQNFCPRRSAAEPGVGRPRSKPWRAGLLPGVANAPLLEVFPGVLDRGKGGAWLERPQRPRAEQAFFDSSAFYQRPRRRRAAARSLAPACFCRTACGAVLCGSTLGVRISGSLRRWPALSSTCRRRWRAGHVDRALLSASVLAWRWSFGDERSNRSAVAASIDATFDSTRAAPRGSATTRRAFSARTMTLAGRGFMSVATARRPAVRPRLALQPFGIRGVGAELLLIQAWTWAYDSVAVFAAGVPAAIATEKHSS